MLVITTVLVVVVVLFIERQRADQAAERERVLERRSVALEDALDDELAGRPTRHLLANDDDALLAGHLALSYDLLDVGAAASRLYEFEGIVGRERGAWRRRPRAAIQH